MNKISKHLEKKGISKEEQKRHKEITYIKTQYIKNDAIKTFGFVPFFLFMIFVSSLICIFIYGLIGFYLIDVVGISNLFSLMSDNLLIVLLMSIPITMLPVLVFLFVLVVFDYYKRYVDYVDKLHDG